MRKLKVVSHVHSLWSYDGKWSLDNLASLFRRRGYHALLMSEHDKGFSPARLKEYRSACAAASSPDILVIPGIEYSDADNRVHILVWGNVPFLGEGRPTLELLREVKLHQGIAVFAHPSRRAAWQVFSAEWIPFLLGIEFWNRKTDGWAPSSDAPAILQRSNLAPFVGMDFHTKKQLFPLSLSLRLMGEPTEKNILNALVQRNFEPKAFGMLAGRMHDLPFLASALTKIETGRKRLARFSKSRRSAGASKLPVKSAIK